MKQKNDRITDHLVEFHRAHKIFAQRVQQELKRAERYCEFLSLMVIDITSLSKFARKKARLGPGWQTLEENLENTIRRSVRETDIVSKFEKGRLALLLTETPKEGANCVRRRLTEELKMFVSSSFKVPQGWEAPAEIVSFPDKENGKERFLAFTQGFERG